MNSNFLRRLYSIWRPEMYHGFGHKQGFFQGWYFKLVIRLVVESPGTPHPVRQK
ncbi:MAG: hypothetical protein NTV14_10395 [Coprothermobacterota bacterium]|nr:hypothetical protein [Coprothermobacterota bacterium]